MKIAILMSTYNGEEYLSKQVESIKNQTNNDWHLYIRDDGSTDSTFSILKEISDKDKRITFVNKDDVKNVGVIRSFMSLLESTDADFYMFSDQDDVWKENKIQRALSLMKHQDYQSTPICLHTELQIVDDNLQPVELMKRGRVWSDFQHFLFGNCVTGCTVMINQKLKQMINFDSVDYSRIAMHDWLFADINENIDMSGDCKGLNQNNICEECMFDAQHDYCCKLECGEHEFCRGCQNAGEQE